LKKLIFVFDITLFRVTVWTPNFPPYTQEEYLPFFCNLFNYQNCYPLGLVEEMAVIAMKSK